MSNFINFELITRILSKIIFPISIAILSILFFIEKTSAEEYQPLNTFQDCLSCSIMVVIPHGNFLMGISEINANRELVNVKPMRWEPLSIFGISEYNLAKNEMIHEEPQHLVVIKTNFSIGQNLVTKREFSLFVQDTGYVTGECIIWSQARARHINRNGWSNPGFSQTELDPVVCVSWNDANAYIAWLNKKTNGEAWKDKIGHYQLPSEAEWEYAARAGTITARWWGDTIGLSQANCMECGSLDYKPQTVPVGSFPSNPFGLSDMLGNVWELTEDCWVENYAGAPTDGKARMDGDCDRRVRKGGSWHAMPWLLRTTTRIGVSNSNLGFNDTGFRLKKLNKL